MIGRSELAEAARNADAIAEELGIQQWANQHGVELSALHYMADQRAMRAAYLMIDGGDPIKLQTAQFQHIKLSPRAESMRTLLMGVFIDGFAVGKTVKGDEYFTPGGTCSG